MAQTHSVVQNSKQAITCFRDVLLQVGTLGTLELSPEVSSAPKHELGMKYESISYTFSLSGIW